MLQSLYIENIAVIEKTSIEFQKGLNILTGETGAGKSILIDALCAVLGERTSKDLVRTGAEKALVTAQFTDLSQEIVREMEEMGIPDEEATLLLQRMIRADGKNVCRANGMPVTISTLKTLGGQLVNIHGQHDGQALLSSDRHMEYIDKMAGGQPLYRRFSVSYNGMKELERELLLLQTDETKKEQKLELLRYQIEELEQADIRPGELEELTRRKSAYLNSEKVQNSLNDSYLSLMGDEEGPGARELLSRASSSLEEAAEYLEELRPVAARLLDLAYEMEDCGDAVRDSLSELAFDPQELEELEERLELLHRLSRKYGPTEEEMAAFLEGARKELDQIEFADARREECAAELARSREETLRLAEEISTLRKESLQRFVERVTGELVFLDMPKVTFVADHQTKELGADGVDRIVFLISVNPGEPPKPLSKIASGGELSRIMLAIKNVLTAHDDVDTLIFDEVDTGVSGSAAQKIGCKLKEVSHNRQVVCITHLAQIAAQADAHLLIHKEISEDKTYTQVTPLDREGRIEEIARIMGGRVVTDLMKKSAQQLLEDAETAENGG